MNAISEPVNETRKRIAARYAALDGKRQAVLLARVADRLTLLARDTYDATGGVADNVRLRAFNEAQNRVLAQLVRVITTDRHRYPDDVFANILVDQCEILRVDPEQILGSCLDAPSAAG
ncbi:MAG TPA: hypothetical protein VGG99_01145 [Acetobacteraceae bacterium]|jgi:hypothetical protein